MRFQVLFALVFCLLIATRGVNAEAPKIRVGIIGMDAHALAWTKIINSPEATGAIAKLTIVAGVPGGSEDIADSMSRIQTSVPQIAALGVEIVDSVDLLLPKVDALMILSGDGRKHLGQFQSVVSAGKPVFIDKPMAGSLADVNEIFRLSKQHDVPCFTSSALRFGPSTANIRQHPQLGEVVGCDHYAPCSLEPHHPDFFWYGIHGVEPLLTIMGSGCRSVTRVHSEGTDIAVGVWDDGRIGTFRGIRDGQRGYRATVFGTKGIVLTDGFEGYEPLLGEIVQFFETRKPPVTPEQTLEVFAFMEAADESRRLGGAAVTLESVMQKLK